MSQVITKRFRVSRRRFLKGLTLAGDAGMRCRVPGPAGGVGGCSGFG